MDCSRLCLQLLALVSPPALFIESYEGLISTQYEVSLLLEVLCEESFLINCASEWKKDSTLEVNAKKLLVISCFGVQKKLSTEKLNELLKKYVLDLDRVDLSNALRNIAIFDKNESTFSIKPEYEGLLERLFLARNNKVYEHFYEHVERTNPQEFQKDNLIAGHKKMGDLTLCCLVCLNLCSCKKIADLLRRYYFKIK